MLENQSRRRKFGLVAAAGMLLASGIFGGLRYRQSQNTQSAEPATATATPVAATDWQAYDSYLRQQTAAGAFSGAVLVANAGQPLLERGYGLANQQTGVANTTQTKFCIASLGKMFTAVAITQLVEQHKLSFDDTIGKYVAGFPAEIADKVTIHQLLTHTAGLGDALRRRDATTEPPSTIAGLLAQIVKEPLQFAPGSQFAYSNSGYIVLGAILEQVSGQSYNDYIHEHVFTPAGMTDTDIRAYTPREIAGMAYGYFRVGQDGQPPLRAPGAGADVPSGTWHDNGTMLQIGNPSGGAYSTVGDLLKFAQALTSHRLLSSALTATLLAGKVDSPRPGGPAEDKYAYGFSDQQVNGVRIVGHNGGTPGYEGQLDIYPDRGYVVVILTNQDQALVPAIQKSEALLTQ